MKANAGKKARCKGSLDVVGTGITAMTQVTAEALECIRTASKLVYLVTDPVTEHWLLALRPNAENLDRFYGATKNRWDTYSEITERILHFVRRGLRVCAAFYGHPGFFCMPSHEAIRRARKEGFPARMLPGIASFDCLIADLGIDPATHGCQSFLANDFLAYSRKFDPRSSLIIWQPALVGEFRAASRACNRRGLRILTQELRKNYPADHEVVIYEASQFVVADPVIRKVRLSALPRARMTPISTLYIPPRSRAHLDRRMVRLLGVPKRNMPVQQR